MEILPKDPILEFHPNTLSVVRKLYNLDDPGRIDEAIDKLQEWLKMQHHFVKKDFSRDYLERILITMKGSIERSKARLDKICTMRTLLPQFFGNYNVKTDFNNLGVARDIMLPKLTGDQYRVYIFKNDGTQFTSSFFTNFYKSLIVFCEYYNAHDYAAGVVAIFDFEELNVVEYAMKINPVELHQIMTVLIEGYGSRIKGIHIITPSKMIDTLVSIFKKVVSEKIASRIHVHKNFEAIHEYVEKCILPKEYGGDERSVNELHDEWLNLLSSKGHMDYMRIMNAAGTNETHRRRDRFNEEYLGMPGTFRTLNVD